MMKKMLIVSAVMFVSLGGMALAQEGSESSVASVTANVNSTTIDQITDPGLLPDSQFYFLKSWWEDIELAFTFNEVKKAELLDKFASRRLIEIQKLLEKGEDSLAEQHMEKFRNRVEKLQQQVEKAQNKGKDVDALIEKLEANSLRQQEVLAEVYENVPEQAQEAILQAMEHSAEGLQNAIDKVQGTGDAEEYREQLQERFENMGEDIQNRLQERLENKRGQSNDGEDEEVNGNNENDGGANESSNSSINGSNANSNMSSGVNDGDGEENDS